MEEKEENYSLLKDFIIQRDDNDIFNLQLIKLEKDHNLTLKIYKKNSIYNIIFSKKIIIEDFQKLNFIFYKINKLDSIIQILLEIFNSNSATIKEIKYDSLLLLLKYDKTYFNLLLLKETNEISEQKKFINNPNLFFKEIITENNDSCGILDIFEIFIDFNNYKVLASPNKQNHKIDLYNLDYKNKLLKSLKGHNNFITFIKLFYDPLKNRKYLISIDNIKLVIIWDICNNYSKRKIILDYKGLIYNASLIFNIYDNDYLITTSYNLLEYTKLFSFDTIKFIRNIYYTDKNNTRYTITWERENYEGFYLIEFCDHKISIVNIFEDEIFFELKTDDKNEKYNNGFLFYKNNVEYLCCGGWEGNIYIWNMKELILENKIELYDFYGLGYLIPWSDNIIIVTSFIERGIIIVDFKYSKIVSFYPHMHDKGIVCIKKIYHNIYGESLLIGFNDGIIKLWVSKEI